MFKSIKSVFTGSDITKYSAVVPADNVATIPVTANGKSGFVKVPIGLPPGAVFYYKDKDIFQKPDAIVTSNHPGVSSSSSSYGQQPYGQQQYGQQPYGQQPVVAATVVSVAPVGYYPQDQLYNANSAATAPSAIVYENNATKNGYVATSLQAPKAATYRVEVPIDARSGQTFHCIINGERVSLVVPPGASYGTILTVQGPAPVEPSAPPVIPPEYPDIPVATVIYCDGVYYNGYTGPVPSAPPQQYR